MTRFEGTFRGRTTGPDFGDAIQFAVITGAAIGLAVIIAEFAWLILAAGAVAVAARLYLLHRKNVAIAVIAAKAALVRQEQAALAAAALDRRMRHEIAVAEAGRIVIQNVIDPAALIAAAMSAQPQPAPVPVVHGELER